MRTINGKAEMSHQNYQWVTGVFNKLGELQHVIHDKNANIQQYMKDGDFIRTLYLAYNDPF